MKKQETQSFLLPKLLPILTSFLLGERKRITEFPLENSRAFHYYREVIRFWNSLNFIVRRTLQALNLLTNYDNYHDPDFKALFFYVTYRLLWENVPYSTLLTELKPYRHSDLLAFLRKVQTFDWQRALQKKPLQEQLSLQLGYPTFVLERLIPLMALDEIKANLQAMNTMTGRTEFTLRMNLLLEEKSVAPLRTTVCSELEKDGIFLRPDSNIPNLFHIAYRHRAQIMQTDWFKHGILIFQDKASIAVTEILAPHPNEQICDLCAAPGMKTSCIAQLMKNTGKIIALDFSPTRIQQMKSLLNLYGVNNTQLINCDGGNLPLHSDLQFDRILLDAPCTGSGTFSQHPELKWRQNASFLSQNTSLQKMLLKTALAFLRPQGVLVYSTCSLYPEEGELQIIPWLDRLKPLPLPDWLSPSYTINGKTIVGSGRLFPSTHQTQGFFIGNYRKL